MSPPLSKYQSDKDFQKIILKNISFSCYFLQLLPVHVARRGILPVYLLLVSLHSTACDHTTAHCTAITKLSCTVLHKATQFCTVLHYPNYGVLFCITLRPSLPDQPPQAVSQTPAGVWQDSANNLPTSFPKLDKRRLVRPDRSSSPMFLPVIWAQKHCKNSFALSNWWKLIVQATLGRSKGWDWLNWVSSGKWVVDLLSAWAGHDGLGGRTSHEWMPGYKGPQIWREKIPSIFQKNFM